MADTKTVETLIVTLNPEKAQIFWDIGQPGGQVKITAGVVVELVRTERVWVAIKNDVLLQTTKTALHKYQATLKK